MTIEEMVFIKVIQIMGYKDNFYTKENIIGYTGKLNGTPTIYFKNGNKYGHITQSHSYVTNIGRETVREDANYKITNTGRKGVAEEYANGEIFHTSRNAFIGVTSETRNELAKSITKLKDEKEYPKNGGLLIDKQGRKFRFNEKIDIVQVK